MHRPPPGYTRTNTLFHDTTRFPSARTIAERETRTGSSLARLEESGGRLSQALTSLVASGEQVSTLLANTAEHITVHDDIDGVLRTGRLLLDQEIGRAHV